MSRLCCCGTNVIVFWLYKSPLYSEHVIPGKQHPYKLHALNNVPIPWSLRLVPFNYLYFKQATRTQNLSINTALKQLKYYLTFC